MFYFVAPINAIISSSVIGMCLRINRSSCNPSAVQAATDHASTVTFQRDALAINRLNDCIARIHCNRRLHHLSQPLCECSYPVSLSSGVRYGDVNHAAVQNCNRHLAIRVRSFRNLHSKSGDFFRLSKCFHFLKRTCISHSGRHITICVNEMHCNQRNSNTRGRQRSHTAELFLNGTILAGFCGNSLLHSFVCF